MFHLLILVQYQFIFRLTSSNFAEDMTFILNFPKQITFGTYSCSLTPNANPASVTSCTISNNKLTINTGTNFALFSQSGKTKTEKIINSIKS